MLNTIAMLQQVVGSHHIFGVVIPYVFKWPVFPLFSLPALKNCIGDLNIGIIHFVVPKDEIAFKLADPANAHSVSQAFCVKEYYVFQNRSKMDAVICVRGIIKTEVCDVILFFSRQRPPRFHVKPVAFIQHLCVDESLDIAADRLPAHVVAVFVQIFVQVIQAGGRAKIVDDIVSYCFKGSSVPDFYAPANVLFEDLFRYALRIAALIRKTSYLNRPRKTAFENILLKLR